MSIVGGSILCMVSICFCKPILFIAGAKTEYAIPVFISLALSAPSVTLHGILAGLGDTKTVLKANVFGNIINILCNALLIYGIGPFPNMGVLGAGIGTLIGTMATLCVTLTVFSKIEYIATLCRQGNWIPQNSYLKQIIPLSGGVLAEQSVQRGEIGMINPAAYFGFCGKS